LSLPFRSPAIGAQKGAASSAARCLKRVFVISTKWQAAGSSALHLFGRYPAAHAQGADQNPRKDSNFGGKPSPRRVFVIRGCATIAGCFGRAAARAATSVVEIELVKADKDLWRRFFSFSHTLRS